MGLEYEELDEEEEEAGFDVLEQVARAAAPTGKAYRYQ